MSIEATRQLLSRVKHPVSSSWSIPPNCYHDEEWSYHEQELLFRKGWLCIGRVDQWKDPGDFEAIRVADVPIIVVLDENRKLSALSNSCLHRSSQIMSGQGRCKALVCPFHGWSYDFSGQVISAPRMETTGRFSERDQHLQQFHVQVVDGFVFLSLQESPDPIQDWVGDFSDLHLPWALSDLVTGRRRVLDVNCNWKLFIEVFNEYYHLPYVHPDSINSRYPEPDAADVVMGEYTTQFGVTSGNPALLDGKNEGSFPIIGTLNERQRSGTRYTWVYPNMTFAAGADCLWMYHVYPISSTRTRAIQTICFPSETVLLEGFQERAEVYYERFDLAIEEDIPALEMQQVGMQSPYAKQGRFSALEPSVGNFACWYASMTS